MPDNNFGFGFTSTPHSTPEVRDYDVTQNFLLTTEDGQRHVHIGETLEVLFVGSEARKFRCKATKGKWLPADKHLAEVLDTRLKPMKVVKSPGPIEEIEQYVVTSAFELVPQFELAEAQVVEVKLRNGSPRGIRLDPTLMWTVVPDTIADAIEEGLLVKVENGSKWVSYVVTVPFFVEDMGFAKGDEVEVKGDIIRHKGSTSKPLSADPEILSGWLAAVPAVPAERLPEQPELNGHPMDIALSILPTIKEVFHWVPGHDWMVTSPRDESEKVCIEGHIDDDWYLQIVIDENETLAVLMEDTQNKGSHPVKDRIRAILNTHEWTDFVGWLSMAAGMATHPIKVRGSMFLTTKTVQIASNRWEEGHVIHALTDESEDRILELVAEGALVPFTDGAIGNCEGCWHHNQSCTRKERWKDRKCDEWTLTEPPPSPPKQRYQSHCQSCEHRGKDETTNIGNVIKHCKKGCDPYSTAECFDYEIGDDIPF